MDNSQKLSTDSEMVMPSQKVLDSSYFSKESYEVLYKKSIENPDAFWAEMAEKELFWFKKWDTVLNWQFPNYTWFEGGKTNITVNCLDRHVSGRSAEKIAYIYVNERGEETKITYLHLLEKVSQFSNALEKRGIKKGDRISIYMPLGIEQIIAMLACARIGAIHTVVYAGFSANALKMRLIESESKLLITSVYALRRGKEIDLLSIAREAVVGLDFIQNIVLDRRKSTVPLIEKELDMQDFYQHESKKHEAPALDSETPLFILYTSGTTGKPKGVVHTHAGYNLYTHLSLKYAFDVKEEDIYWCTADTGWITGHSYIVYGPLSNATTTFLYEGAPDFPNPEIWWQMIEKYQINQLYTAPTAIRMFMKLGEEFPDKYKMESLKVLGSVGEPINPEAWTWYHKHIGKKNIPVVDTFWQTETGGHILLTLPSIGQKPGKAGLPFFGIELDVIHKDRSEYQLNSVGVLVINKPWPGALRTCWNAPELFENYWNEIPGKYFAGDLATKDKDGYIQILGRADDVLNVSGHRIGTAEVESALVASESVAEAAVIGKPHEIKGESIKAFVILKNGFAHTEQLIEVIRADVKRELGSIGLPDEIEVVQSLPKTRSGKIMRRVLKAKEMGMDLGDTSTLED